MTVLEQAKELGLALADSAVVRALNDAKTAYEQDTVLRRAMQEYNAQRAALGEEFSKDPDKQDETIINALKARIEKLHDEIVTHEAYLAFIEAQKGLKKLMDEVNSEISFYAFGERPCTHDCSTCSSTSCKH